jgi:hypothetical protein
MAFLNDTVLDEALSYISSNASHLYLCSSEVSVYANLSSATLGDDASPSFTGPTTGDTSGRKLTVDATTAGSVTATGTASHWAIATTSGSAILAAGPLSSSQSVTSGNTFTLTAFDIELRDPS